MLEMTTRQIKMFFASSKKGNPVLLVRFHFKKYALSLYQTYLVYEICVLLSHESNLRLRIGPLQSDHTFLVCENFIPQSLEFILRYRIGLHQSDHKCLVYENFILPSLEFYFRFRIGLVQVGPHMSGLRNLYAAFVRVQFSIQNWTCPNRTIHIWFTESVCCVRRSPIFDSELDP